MLEFLKDNYMQHLGYLFTFLALSIKDVLWLRIILALAQLLLGIYQLLENQLEIVFWNAIFTMVNVYHIIRIINDRKIICIPKEIKDKISQEVKEAHEWAKSSPYPEKENLRRDIFCE